MNKRSSLSGKKNREKAVNTVCFLLVVFFSALCLLPIWWIFRSSLMTNNQLYSSNVPFLPPDWLFSNYSQALKNFPFWTYLKNTLTIIVRLDSGLNSDQLYGTPSFRFIPDHFTAVPYCLWCNRTPGEMSVWLTALIPAPAGTDAG